MAGKQAPKEIVIARRRIDNFNEERSLDILEDTKCQELAAKSKEASGRAPSVVQKELDKAFEQKAKQEANIVKLTKELESDSVNPHKIALVKYIEAHFPKCRLYPSNVLECYEQTINGVPGKRLS